MARTKSFITLINVTITGMAAASAAIASYIFDLRPWHLRWGATHNQVNRTQPGKGQPG